MIPGLRHTALAGALALLFPAMVAMAGDGYADSGDDTSVEPPFVVTSPPFLPASGDDPFNSLPVLGDEPVQVDPEAWVDTALVRRGNRLPESRYSELTDDDYREVAEVLGVETAAIKAVVDIEAGRAHQGFWAPGKPLINFDLSIFRKRAAREGVSLKKAQKSHPVAFARPDVKRYGSYQAGQQARLDAACEIHRVAAMESTFWGMFQIGGFNWNKCGTDSVEDFVRLMSRSERDQLELFASFIRNNGMVEAIRNRQWLRFALRYNGPKAKSRGYHTRLAAAYRRHKALEK